MTLPDPRTIACVLGGEAHGNSVSFPTPGHSKGDRGSSLTINPGAPDGFIVHCHNGEDDLVLKDYVRQALGLPSWEPSPKINGKAASVVIAEYIYRDAEGRPSRKVVRTADKSFPQYTWTGSSWRKGATGTALLPYRLPELIPALGVCIVEGEKDADRLASLGFVATTNPMGAGKWKPELNRWFAGKTVTIFPDNDKEGLDHAYAVAGQLVPIAAEVRILELPGLPEKGDVSDWLDADPSGIEALADMVDAAPRYGGSGASKKAAAPSTLSMRDLRGMDFPEIKYIVTGYVPEGLTIFAGKPKVGKSWWCLDVCIAVASPGRLAFGSVECAHGEVLYMALEDNLRRLQKRMQKLLPQREWPADFHFTCEWPKLDQGGLEAIASWLDEHPRAKLIVIDTLKKVRGLRSEKDSAYEADYNAVEGLQRLAGERGVAIILVHHTRKMEADDPLDCVSGTLGLSAAPDTILVLHRGHNGTVFYGRGRDIEEIETAVKFDPDLCQWRVLGEAEQVHRSNERNRIIAALREHGNAMTPREIADATLMGYGNVRQFLLHMVKAGEVEKQSRGRYTISVANNANSLTARTAA